MFLLVFIRRWTVIVLCVEGYPHISDYYPWPVFGFVIIFHRIVCLNISRNHFFLRIFVLFFFFANTFTRVEPWTVVDFPVRFRPRSGTVTRRTSSRRPTESWWAAGPSERFSTNVWTKWSKTWWRSRTRSIERSSAALRNTRKWSTSWTNRGLKYVRACWGCYNYLLCYGWRSIIVWRLRNNSKNSQLILWIRVVQYVVWCYLLVIEIKRFRNGN